MQAKKRILTYVTVFVFIFSLMCAGGTVMAESTALPAAVAHYTFDRDVSDSSGNKNDGSITSTKGGQGVSIVKGVMGNGAKFDGASYIEVPNSSSLNLSKNFTFSVWLYKDDVRPNADEPILEKTVPVVDEEPMSDGVAYQFSDSLDATYATFETSDAMEVDSWGYTYNDFQKWSLITVTGDGQTIKYYKNGKLVDKSEKAYDIANSTGDLHIGITKSTDGEFYKGIMDDLIIFNTVLTPLQISTYYQNVYNGVGKEVLVKKNALVAHYKFDDNFKDASEYGNHGPDDSVLGITFEQGKIGKAARFNGSSFIEVPDSDSLDLKDTYTFSLWLKRENTPDESYPILAKTKSSFGDGGDDAYTFFAENDGTSIRDFSDWSHSNYVTTRKVAPVNTWYMLTGSYDGKQFKFYLDGKLTDKQSAVGIIRSSSGDLLIGNAEWTGSYFFKGLMDDLRIYNYALPDAEISKLYTQTDKLTAAPVKVDNLAVNASTTLKIGYTALGSTKSADVTASALYSTSDAKVAKVVNGKVTGVKKGKATITATFGGNSVSIPIVVK